MNFAPCGPSASLDILLLSWEVKEVLIRTKDDKGSTDEWKPGIGYT